MTFIHFNMHRDINFSLIFFTSTFDINIKVFKSSTSDIWLVTSVILCYFVNHLCNISRYKNDYKWMFMPICIIIFNFTAPNEDVNTKITH